MSTLDEARLIEKLRSIEALYARPGTAGEQAAAANARERILERLEEMATRDAPVEYRFSMADAWSRRVFVALLRRYGIRPYRYRRQRYTTVMAKVSTRFVDETLWPEFEAINASLRAYLDEVTDRVVKQVIHDDLSEAAVVTDAQLQLPAPPPTTSAPSAAPKPDESSATNDPDATSHCATPTTTSAQSAAEEEMRRRKRDKEERKRRKRDRKKQRKRGRR